MSIRVSGRQESRLLGRVIRVVCRQRERIPEDARRFFERDPVAGAIAPLLVGIPRELQLSISPKGDGSIVVPPVVRRWRSAAETSGARSGSVRLAEVPIVTPGYVGIAPWVKVLAADGERRPHAIIARRRRHLAVELRVHAASNRFRQRNAEAASVTRQSPVLIFGKLYLSPHHDGASVPSADGAPPMTPSRAATRPGWPVEVKSGATIASDWFGALGRVVLLLPGCETGAVVHGGDDRQTHRRRGRPPRRLQPPARALRRRGVAPSSLPVVEVQD